MTASRIICIGNRYVDDDDAGARVFDRLKERDLPPELDVVEGGLAGLDLLRLVEGTERVVLVDRVNGFGPSGHVAILNPRTVASAAEGPYHHAAGIPYLLRILPEVCAPPMPDIRFVGIEGPADDAAIDRAADLALDLVLDCGNNQCIGYFRNQALALPNATGGRG